jgi:peptidoglycan hydrolase-like protein with peptidoglycan-binding domain
MIADIKNKLIALEEYLKKSFHTEAFKKVALLLKESQSNPLEKDSAYVRRLQKALIRAGFPLPRSGPDGSFGGETRKALIDFKTEASGRHLYSGEIDESINLKDIKLIESYPASEWTFNKDGDDLVEKRKDFTLYIGDSQMEGKLGQALRSKEGGVYRTAMKRSTSPAYWAKNSGLKKLLKEGPSKIIISLNGNGNTGASALIETILSLAGENVPVLWTGAPPPIKRPRSYIKKVRTTEDWYRYYLQRQEWNNEVGAITPDSWTFVDPYKYIKYDSPKKVGKYVVESGYECSGCDGVHLPSQVAQEYASQIGGLV